MCLWMVGDLDEHRDTPLASTTPSIGTPGSLRNSAGALSDQPRFALSPIFLADFWREFWVSIRGRSSPRARVASFQPMKLNSNCGALAATQHTTGTLVSERGFPTHDKLGALEKLAKVLGLYVEPDLTIVHVLGDNS
jgi:hypothetical protein